MIEASEIAGHLPHRYPMLLIDRILHIEESISGISVKNITGSESYFEKWAVMPEVLIVECMAQTAGIVVSYKREKSSNTDSITPPQYLAMVQNLKFSKRVAIGDQLIIEVRVIKQFGHLVKIYAEAKVRDDIIASGTLTLAN